MQKYRANDRPQNFSDEIYELNITAGTPQSVGIPHDAKVAKISHTGGDTVNVLAALDEAVATAVAATAGTQAVSFDSVTGASSISLPDYNSGYQEVSFTSAKDSTDSTGLAADTHGTQEIDFDVTLELETSTGYDLTDNTQRDIQIAVDGGSAVTKSYRAGDLPTVSDVVRVINKDFDGVDAYLEADAIVVRSQSTGTSSAIDITQSNSDLLTNMNDFNTVSAATAGTTTNYTADIALDGGAASTVTVNGDDAQTFAELLTEIESQIAASGSMESGKLRITSDSTAATSAVAITDTDLFSSLTDFSAVDAATAATQITYTMDVAVDGGSDQTVSLNAGDFTTFTELAADISTALTGASAAVDGSKIVITSDTTGYGSTIDSSEGNLLTAIPEYTEIEDADDGNAPKINAMNVDAYFPDVNVENHDFISIDTSASQTVYVAFFG